MKLKENEYIHIGSYGLIIKDKKILLINKVGGPYDGKLDLPGGTIEFYETPKEALIRELKEEVGINVIDYSLLDVNSVNLEWIHKEELEKIKHIYILYKINKYDGDIKENVEINSNNDDSKGSKYYDIDKLNKDNLSSIVLKVIERLKYELQ